MEILTQKFKRDPNAMVHSAYVGIAPGTRTVTRITSLDKEHDKLATTRVYGPGMPRGQGGQVATIILAGMETTLDEVEYMLEAVKEKKKFAPVRAPADIVEMCRMVAERRNERIKHLRKNPSEVASLPRRKRPGLYLPKGYRMVQTPIPGFRIAKGA